jgi:hypothetical protein
MHTSLLLCALFGIIAVPGSAGTTAATVVEVRLLTPVSTYNSRAGDPVEAVVGAPVCAQGHEALPKGTVVRGVIKHIHKVGLGFVHETAGLQIEFREFRLPDGSKLRITRHDPAPGSVEARLASVDSARERVDKRGTIHGIRATESLSNRLGERLAFAALDHPFTLVPVLTIASSLVRFPDPEIQYARGTELNLNVWFPPSFGPVGRCAFPKPASTAGLAKVVDGLPAWSYSVREHRPMDPITLVFIGSRGEVARAFAAAGWDGSRPTSVRSGLIAMRAIAEVDSYDDAPMRTLMLDGSKSDFSFQKALNTFSKRHHLRAWRRDPAWEGRPVWAASATQDIGVSFSMRPFGFTHEIENDVDLEREKVVSDLEFGGCVDSVTYVPRAVSLRDSGDYRKGVLSDSRVAVLVLNACRAPRQELEVADFDAPPPGHPGIAVRTIRRVTLTLRNHFLRDNIVWRSADAARLGVRAFQHWREQRRDEREASKQDAAQENAEVRALAPAPEPLPMPPELALPAGECCGAAGVGSK